MTLSKKLNVLIVCGTPKIRLKEAEEGGVPLSESLKRLLDTGNDTPIHISYPGVGPVTLATYLSNNGITVAVKDWYADPVDLRGYDVIGISGTHLDFDHLRSVVLEVHRLNPAAVIVVGGPVTLTYPIDKLLGELTDINYLVFNEGEKTFLELLRAIEAGGELSGISGIGYRDNGRFITTPRRQPLHPDEFCIPDWTLMDLSRRIPLLSIETARGCAYTCAYCFEVNFWGKPVRFRRPEVLIDELRINYEKFGITTYRIADSCFTTPEDRCAAICDRIIREFIQKGIPIRWSCYARINNLKKDLLTKMKEAGCVAICVGMESGDATVLKNMNKFYSSDQIIGGITNAREAGIITHCNIIVGFPGETPESIATTISTLNAARPSTYHCMTLDIAPDTVLANNKTSYSLSGDRLEWEHHTMSSREAKKFIYEIMNNVKYSTHLPMGDVLTVLLTADGHALPEIRMLLESIANATWDEKERRMMNRIFRREHTVS
jgi:radical SAM superfamily enzyme YgiQ (UPF0313 family)